MDAISILRRAIPGFILALLVILMTGCATQRVDWTARVGNYSYDQAVLDYGPPAREARLTDGTRVVEWQTQRGYTEAYYPPYYSYGYRHRWGWYAPPMPMISSTPDVFLRLTFDPAGKLVAWKKVLL
jgi:hypothetical protein